MKYIIRILVLSLILYSCKKNANNTNCLIFEQDQINKIIFDSIQFIPLETDTNYFLGNNVKVKLYKECIFCLNRSPHQSLYKFNNNGKFLCKIGKRGKGPDEYQNIVDFAITNDTIILLTSKGKFSEFSFYDIKGNLLLKKRTDFIVESFEKVNQTYILYVSYYKQIYDYRVFVVDENFNVISRFLPNNSRFDLTVKEDNFWKSTEYLTFVEAFNNSTYILKKDSLYKNIEFDFGKYSIPNQFYKLNPFEGFDMISKRGFANIKRYYKTQDFDVFVIVKQKSDNFGELVTFVYNNKLKISSRLINDENDPSIFYNLVELTPPNNLVFLFYPYQINKKKDEILKMPIINKEVIFKIKETDNPIVAICKIKYD